MIKSMTGFGRAEVSFEQKKFTVEVKSVNHRYLDMNIRLPKRFNAYENDIRNIIKRYATRGKVDMYISYENIGEDSVNLKFNEELASQYAKYYGLISDKFGIDNNLNASILANCHDVLTMEETEEDIESLWPYLSQALNEAMTAFVAEREKEGANLAADLQAKLDNIRDIVDFVSVRSPKVLEEYRQKLYDKVNEVLEDKTVDENRIATEVVIYSDKMCVDEELVRLKSHIEKMSTELKGGQDVGKKLDFLAQEMNREANTTMSKANDLEITDKGIELKVEIEKIREQIQNIE